MKGLLWPLAVPLGLCVVFFGGWSLGIRWNPHTTFGLFILLFGASTAVGVLIELFMVPISVMNMRRFPALRTSRNIAAVAVGGVFVAVAVPLLIAGAVHFL